jgi:hypothetical protein
VPASHRSNAISVVGRHETLIVHVSLVRRPGLAVRCDTCPGADPLCQNCGKGIFSFQGVANYCNGAVVCGCGHRYLIEAAGPHCEPKKKRPSSPVTISHLAPTANSDWKRK